MKKQSKGITLIVLVMTIIVLLILAGVSVAEFTGHGLFAQAQKAKLEEKRGTITEWLSVKLIEEQTNNPFCTAEEIIELTRENVINNQNELEKMGKNIKIDDISNEEDGKQVEVYFYVMVDEDVYKVEQSGVKFFGREEELPPIIKITKVTNTTNTITVLVETKRNEEGKIEYWIKAEDEEEYRKIEETEEKKYTYEGLTQSKKYNIKVIAVAKNKKTAEATSEAITGSVTGLTTANATFTYSPAQGIWTNKNVTATVSTTVSGFTIQTSQDGKTWNNTASQTFTENGTVYARLWDGTNAGGALSGNVTNIDITKPVVTELTTTTNSIRITATDEASGIIEYAVTTNETEPSESDYITVENTKILSTTVTEKTQGTIYYVWVKDEAGNVISKSTETGNVAGLTTSNTTFSYSPAQGTWTNGSVTATVSTTVTGFTLQTSKDGTTWDSTASQTFTANGTVYARLWDGTNAGATLSGNVTNIDTTKPVVTGATSTTNSIAITARDEASGIVGYAVTTSNTAPSDSSYTTVTSTTSLSTTVSGKTQGTTYYVWVKDAAGNVSASKSTATGSVTGLTTSNTTFSYNPSGWTNGNVTVTVSTTVSGYTLQTSTNGSSWSSTASQTFTANGTVYARLWDGTNAGATLSANVTNIDKTLPSVPGITYNSGSNECKWENNINITLSSSDSQSGVSYYEIDWNGDGNSNATTGSNFIPWNGYSSCNTRFRAVDAAGNRSGWTGSIHIHMDTERPVHTNWWYGYVGIDKITLYIQVSDNIGIQRVQCPTSTATGGYSNWVWIDTVWDSSANAYRADIYPSTWGHYNTTYLTHLYIYDHAGNGGYYNQASTYLNGNYTISYNANGGSGSMSTTTGTINQAVGLRTNGFTAPSGKVFVCWSTNPEGTGAIYKNGSSYTQNSVNNVTLYAIWGTQLASSRDSTTIYGNDYSYKYYTWSQVTSYAGYAGYQQWCTIYTPGNLANRTGWFVRYNGYGWSLYIQEGDTYILPYGNWVRGYDGKWVFVLASGYLAHDQWIWQIGLRAPSYLRI